ncbi:MAG: hypothetical protein PHQ66_00485 [Candidatus Nanoarchaeia archaeon]|nr:hypothetical protein [Candidatus Nanoarchaeia archaeon]MDD5358077.1 hypothetical protein [Candidatus Nanoarchaeia archaeon]MDD5589265.1 hypothetical protein [Candidatus Nanoarchaeia archaeon]
MRKDEKRYQINPISFFSGVILLCYSSSLIIEKVINTIKEGKNILSVNLSFDISQILTLLFFCLIFLLSALIKDKEILYKSMPKFFSWIIHTSISTLLIYLLILFTITKTWFSLIAILILFALFILKEMAEKEAK